MTPLREVGEHSFAWRLAIALQISTLVDEAHQQGLSHPHLDVDAVAIDIGDQARISGWREGASVDDVDADLRALHELVRAVLWPDGLPAPFRTVRARRPAADLPRARTIAPRLWAETGAFAVLAFVVAALAAFGVFWTTMAVMAVVAVSLASRRISRSRDGSDQRE